MPGVPSFILAGPWWGLFLFLTIVVFLRTQATYWLARWARGGTEAYATRAQGSDSRRAQLARKLSGPSTERAREFLERRGYIGIPLSFLTIGFQSVVNAVAGYTRMRFDLYTFAMIPGCLIWAAVYTAIGVSLWEAWLRSPALLVAALAVVVAAAFVMNRWRRRSKPRATAPVDNAADARR